IFDQVGGFDAQAADIREASAAGFAVELAQAAEEPFDTEEIVIGMQAGVIDEERAVAAAEFHFERGGRGKELREVEAIDDRSQFVNERGRGGRCCLHRQKLPAAWRESTMVSRQPPALNRRSSGPHSPQS